MPKKKVYGACQICGIEKQLTQEHYIPRGAGGGVKATLYKGDELLKTLNGDEKPYGLIKQNGLAEYTLCKECNEQSGHLYDKDFADFFNTFTYKIAPQISVPKDGSPEDFLEGKRIEVELMGIKPFNIAKRILVSFCSVEHKGLTDRVPEIRKAIMDKDYQPNTDNFSLYLSLHLGNSAFYGTIAAMSTINGKWVSQAFAGIEADMLAFYYAPHNEHLKGGGLAKCLDITEWLTRYKYDELVNVQLELMFNKSLGLRFPVPKAQ